MADLDIVGGAAVDVVPVAPQFHSKLKAIVLPSADRVGEDAGRRLGDAISRHIVIAIPNAINQGGNAGQRAATRQGSDTGGAFARSLRAKLEAAFKAMPKLDVRLSDTGVDAELARLRARMETLAGKRIGIDVDVAAAEAEVKRIDAELKRLGAQHPNVAVRADTAAARAALAELRAEIASVDALDIDVDVRVDTGAARSALTSLGMQMVALTAIPMGPVIAAGLGAVVSAATAAGAAVGAFGLASVPAIKGVGEALRTQKAAQEDTTQATNAGANAGTQAAQRALQMAGAQQTLATAHRQAATAIANANDGVARAERTLADAQRAELQAQEALTTARKTAAQQLRDLNAQLEEGALSQREAALRVREAEQRLQEVRKDPKATQLQRDEAQLTYDQAKLHAKQQLQDYKDLQQSAKEQQKAGVEGSDVVRQAQERVAAAHRNTADQAAALVKAHKSVAAAQVQAAESIASAERGIAAARLSASTVTVAATTKADEHRAALAKLSPEQRKLYDSIAGPSGLKAAYDAWQKSLQPHTLPIFTRAVDGAKRSLPGLTPLVTAAAAAITTLMDKSSEELKTPFWQGFKRDIATSAKPAIVGLGTAFGNVLKGMAGVVGAFLPHMDGISSTMGRITGRFAKWAAGLKGSPEFERFLTYVKQNSPALGEFIRSVLDALLSASQALAPLSAGMFAVLTPVFNAITWLNDNVPGLVQTLWAFWAVNKAVQLGMVLFSAAMAVYEAVMIAAAIATAGFGAVFNAVGIGPIIRAVVLLVGLLVAGFLLAYNKCEWFRAAVDGAWAGIKIATEFLWKNVLQPVFSGIWTGLQAIGSAAMWLWTNAIGPAFRFIWEAAKILFTILVVAVLLPIWLQIKALGAVAMWLWEHAFKPAFDFISAAALLLWRTVISPVFGFIGAAARLLYDKWVSPAMKNIRTALDAVGFAASWLWNKAIKPSLDFIGDKASWLWEKALKPPFDKIKAAIHLVSEAFGKSKDDIKKAWDQIQGIAKGPVKFIIEHVYNGGIVPLWNRVADITGAKTLKKMDLKGFHTGGVMDGYSPGRDDRIIAVGGGEAIMRPEWTRAVGEETINSWNAAARSGGVGGVQKAIAAGMPAFKDGGVVGWLKSKASGVGDFFSDAGDFLDPTRLFDKAKGFVKDQMKPILKNPWAKEVAKMPLTMLTNLKDSALDFFGFGGGSGGGAWIKPVNASYGTPFGKAGPMWSSGRHTGLDFPAAMGTAIKAVADGKVSQATSGGPYGLHAMISHGGGLSSFYAHMSSLLTSVGKSVKQGQTIGLVGATGNTTGPHLHFEARKNGRPVDPMPYLTGGGGGFGGKAVGSAQAYAKSQLARFGWGPNQFGPLKKLWEGESNWNYRATNPSSGAYGIPQALPASKMASAGADWRSNPRTQIDWGLRYIKGRPDYGSPAAAYSKWLARSPHWYDNGGLLQPGLNLVANGTGKPEPVFTSGQWDDIRAAKTAALPNIVVENHTYLGTQELTDVMDHRIEIYDADLARGIETGTHI
ncbi:peptidoglycan DD-metalloendopeptidase family protein [Streptomyces sp. NPDC056437]|uniref:aggregation-promoting factor C-terminal-like domain-containing protein n=1 Tax=Streptomyces sp. NPDC056437 TaxID=3345816 RepID=UPI0036976F95